MQLKKMREILPTLYASQVNKERSSLMTPPMQESIDKGNPTTTENNCSLGLYQKPEDTKSSQRTCIKCRCVQETSALELQSQRCQQDGDNYYVCNKCTLSMPSVNSVTNPTGVSDTENKEERALGRILKTFKVKNIQPDKHYCDKCRFSTKDPLQYQKHITQHEEIKFVCAICNCASYTKGEFKRHLVKHTGKFPYQCRYCDYGAIRHDYVVKHIKRMHKTMTDKQVQLAAEKAEGNTNCLAEQNTEKRPVQEVPLQKKPSNVSFNTVVNGIQDEKPEIVCTSSSEGWSQDSALIQDKYTVEPPDTGIHENENAVIEVEVYSPPKEPIMPGMPLTVVAPAQFVAPPNCMAEVVEMKNDNGVQQLVLKLISVEELAHRPVKCEAAEYVNQCAEQGEKTMDGSMSPTFAGSCVVDNKCGNECMVFSHSTILNSNPVNEHENNVKGKEIIENDFTMAVADPSPDEISCPKTRYINFYLNSPIYLLPSLPEGGNRPPNSFLDAVQENYSNYLLESNAELQPNKPVHFNGTKSVLATVDEIEAESQKENVCVDSFEAPNVKIEDDSSEGPVISSVFSLSSGAVNIPEGIKWDDTTHKKSSASLLCRKIAQLMSAAESNMKSQLKHKSSPKEEQLSSPEAAIKLEREDLAIKLEAESEPSPQSSIGATSLKGPASGEEEAQPLEAPRRGRGKKRMVNRSHASPVFIPQGTVVRVFDCTCTKGLTVCGHENEKLPSPVLFCNNTFLPRPVSCVVSDKCINTPSSLPTENRVTKTSKNRSASRRRRKKRKLSRKKKRVPAYPKGSEINKANGGARRGKKTKKKGNKAKTRKNLNKESQQSRKDCYIINVDPVLARCLRLTPFKKDQPITCPLRDQPVVVLNHPDVDSQEIINVMKIINKYKCNVVRAILTERTINSLGEKRQHKRLTFQSFDRVAEMKKLNALKMKLRKIHRNRYKVVNSSPAEASKQPLKCCYCGRTYVDPEEYIRHGQMHLMEATRGCDKPSAPVESDEEEIIVD